MELLIQNKCMSNNIWKKDFYNAVYICVYIICIIIISCFLYIYNESNCLLYKLDLWLNSFI